MYLFAKLGPFEQKEHFSPKEQNELGWNQAYGIRWSGGLNP